MRLPAPCRILSPVLPLLRFPACLTGLASCRGAAHNEPWSSEIEQPFA